VAHDPGTSRVDTEWWPSAEIDTTVPHPARVYDYWLGGKDNYAVDRALADSIEQWIPIMPAKVRVNRAFLGRAVRYLADDEDITQFLDIGAGLPTAKHTHEVAEEVAAGTRVLYVDNDPVVVSHGRALMSGHGTGQTAFILGDLREPEAILQHPAFAATLDLERPVAVMMLALLMSIPDAENPLGTVEKLMAALPPGSLLAITHLTADFDPEGVAGLVAASHEQGSPVVARSRAEVEEFFVGLELVPPGLLPVTSWRPDGAVSALDQQAGTYSYAGVGRKPW
jgi:hypothetical protein